MRTPSTVLLLVLLLLFATLLLASTAAATPTATATATTAHRRLVAGNFKFELPDGQEGADGHPLRMEEWVIVLRPNPLWLGPRRWIRPPHRRTQRFAFLENGEVWSISEESWSRRQREATAAASAAAAVDGGVSTAKKGGITSLLGGLKKSRGSSGVGGGVIDSTAVEQCQTKRKRRRIGGRHKGARLQVGSWWFDKCGLRWDVETDR
jgi:hypothetical protein